MLGLFSCCLFPIRLGSYWARLLLITRIGIARGTRCHWRMDILLGPHPSSCYRTRWGPKEKNAVAYSLDSFLVTEAPVPPPPPVMPPTPPAESAQPHTRPIIQYVEREPSMSSLKVRAEKEKELAEAESYWRERIHKLEHEVRLGGPFEWPQTCALL